MSMNESTMNGIQNVGRIDLIHFLSQPIPCPAYILYSNLLLLVIVSNYYTKIPKLLKQFSCKSGHVRPCFYIIEIFFLSDNFEHDQSNYLMLIVKPLSAILLLQTSGKYLHHNYHETQDCSASHLINFISNLVFMLVLNV